MKDTYQKQQREGLRLSRRRRNWKQGSQCTYKSRSHLESRHKLKWTCTELIQHEESTKSSKCWIWISLHYICTCSKL